MSKYDSTSIQVLEGLDPVRKRPGMYIWNTSTEGLHQLVWEVLDNSIDEVMAGHATSIEVVLHQDGSVSVLDDGRGIPIDLHPTEGVSALEVVMCRLHAGGKFDHKSYKVSGGLHGVGVSVVNALSEWLEVQVFKDNQIHEMTFSRGLKTSELHVVGKTERQGTKVTFRPDHTVFDTVDISFEEVEKRCRELAYLLGRTGLKILLRDESSEQENLYCFPNGVVAFIEDLRGQKEALFKDPIYFRESDLENPQTPDDKDSLYAVEVALQYTSDYSENVYCYANNIHTMEGGSHLSGFRSSLTRTLNNYAKKEKLLKDTEKLPTGEDMREGLIAIISVSVPNPQFGGQTKSKLGNREVQSIVDAAVAKHLEQYFEENPKNARTIFRKSVDASRAREAARRARDIARRKTTLASGNLPRKLADCMSTHPEECELFLVEGDSAGGTAKMGRNPEYQAILPLRGKILNVEKSRLDKMLSHNEIQAIISALGTGIGYDEFDARKLRYSKVIIMTDADVDGSHIRTLLLTFFYRHMRSLIEGGNIYIAQPPLFLIKHKNYERYVYTEKEKNDIVLDISIGFCELQDHRTGRGYSTDELRKVSEIIKSAERVVPKCAPSWCQISHTEYMRQWRPEKGLPRYLVKEGDQLLKWLYSENELIAERDRIKAEKGEEVGLWEGPGSDVSFEDATIKIAHFGSSEEVEEVINKMADLGIEECWEATWNDSPRFELKTNRKDHEIEDLFDLRAVLVDKGGDQQLGGAYVQRYKGLGEMNAVQLFDTAMNPETRTLYQVSISNALDADQMFSVLMGTAVEQRRDFIEKHALDVTNLDI